MEKIEIIIKNGWVRAKVVGACAGAHEAAIKVADYETAGPGWWRWIESVVADEIKEEVQDETY